MNWATNHDASIEKLQKVQGSLTVGLIMVDREDFLTCSPTETAQNVMERNPDRYSYVPVVDDNDRVIGLYNAERWFDLDPPATPIADDFQLLSEDIVIGADASLFDFIQQADTHATNLVISGNRVAGLVSLHDIQQLPVRAALFALITSLEMVMAHAIEKVWPCSDDWIEKLSDGRQDKLQAQIASAKQKDSYVSAIAFTQFADKASLIYKNRLLPVSRTSLETKFGAIQSLRDNLAHANSYADNPDDAKSVCETVRSIYKLKEDLLATLET